MVKPGTNAPENAAKTPALQRYLITESPRRKRLQIHLSTAIAMMMVAGIVLGLNIQRRNVRILTVGPNDTWFRKFPPDYDWTIPAWKYGWPADMATVPLEGYFRLTDSEWFRPDRIPPWWYWNGHALAINVAAFIGAIIMTALAAECRARRKRSGTMIHRHEQRTQSS